VVEGTRDFVGETKAGVIDTNSHAPSQQNYPQRGGTTEHIEHLSEFYEINCVQRFMAEYLARSSTEQVEAQRRLDL